ncbi:uncharacterized protein LOC106172815 [Lingula anatina]|uniref:Uncharacterized protein LOC106172815 n=1 Tax=Lingula anatina TaxID=7574 RepID=A0A1S3JFI4_LINAN|nr:uncharacterized protein LOC106172815 [Lingula anatina]|eukprot:XP_013409175.1 uncharacterized protein LOC106172815 [Lingula anatina]
MNAFLQVLLVLQSLTFSAIRASIQCECTTADCSREQKTTCLAEHSCYVQHLPVDKDDGPTPPILRGCINDPTPLLCENRRPLGYKGPWPVLHCCFTNGCNKEVLPPEAPRDDNNTSAQVTVASDIYTSDLNTHHIENAHSVRFHNINPVYIAVPTVGVCSLLAIIIFTIYMLKRHQAHYYKACDKAGNLQTVSSRTSSEDSSVRDMEDVSVEQSIQSDCRLLV